MVAKETVAVSRSEWAICILTSLGTMMLLAFADEGHYNFDWMKNPGNWIATLGFGFLMVLGELLILRRLDRNLNPVLRIGLAFFGGSVLFMVFLAVYGLLIIAVRWGL